MTTAEYKANQIEFEILHMVDEQRPLHWTDGGKFMCEARGDLGDELDEADEGDHGPQEFGMPGESEITSTHTARKRRETGGARVDTAIAIGKIVVVYAKAAVGKEETMRNNFSIGQVLALHSDDHVQIAWWNSRAPKNLFSGWRLYAGPGDKSGKIHKDYVILCRAATQFWNAKVKGRGLSVRKKLIAKIEAGVHTMRRDERHQDDGDDEEGQDAEELDLEENND